eukprot:2837151-Amphidinium_carterae.1
MLLSFTGEFLVQMRATTPLRSQADVHYNRMNDLNHYHSFKYNLITELIPKTISSSNRYVM